MRLSLLLWLLGIVTAFRRQSAWIKGRLLCGTEPASQVLVKLFDQDDGPDPDDLLQSGYTDDDGYFELKGDTVELTNIDPEVRIYHTCSMNIPLCKREWVIGIPDKYITFDRVPEYVFDLGVVNLEVELEDESRDLTALTTTSAIIPEQFTGVQSYRVKGHLLCGTEPAKNVRVKLVDDDFGPDPDDDLENGYTDNDGYFDLSGDTREVTTIDVHLKIYHDCNDLLPCQRRWKFELPNSYITKGPIPTKVLDIGTWNLEAKMPGESHDCIH